MALPPAQTLEQFRNSVDQRPVFAANTELFFEEHSRRKRSAPTPNLSASTTPQEEPEAASAAAASSTTGQGASGFVVTTPHLEDQTAYQITAGHLGHDVNNPKAIESFLNSKVSTARDVLRLVKGYHESIIRPELYGAVVQLETALKKVNDRVLAAQSELRFMASDNRAQQKHQAGLMLVTTGWPTGMAPEATAYMIGWMIAQLPEAQDFLKNRALLRDDMDHTALPPSFWYGILQKDPTTVPQGAGFYSAMTMLNFKAWSLRSAFLSRYGGSSGTPLYVDSTTPQAGRHIRVSPYAPQWQRKLESPLRVLIAVCNSHPDCANKRLTILWKSLTLMAPSDSPDFDPDCVAWARLFYEEYEGTFRGRLEVSPEMSRIMMSGPSVVDSREESLWTEKWNEVMWGQQLVLDQLDHGAYTTAKQEAKGAGKGTAYGAGRRHWSNVLLHNSYFSPYPFEMELTQVEAVAFIWDEFRTKAGAPEHCTGDAKLCTFKGKPAMPTVSADVEMEAETMPPPQPAAAHSKAAPPAPAKSRGRGAKGS